MPKKDENGRKYIEQDGKKYYENISGEWEAEKDAFGNDKVETDMFGNPKIETDMFGNQIIETDCFGNPYVEDTEKDDSGCYLTTACIRVLCGKFSDDCDELTILRNFRDQYVYSNFPKEVDAYYKIAPRIVNAIMQREDCQAVYEQIYDELIIPTIELIKNIN